MVLRRARQLLRLPKMPGRSSAEGEQGALTQPDAGLLKALPQKLSPATILLTARLSSASEASLPATRQPSRASYHRRWDSGREAEAEDDAFASERQPAASSWHPVAALTSSSGAATSAEPHETLSGRSAPHLAPADGLRQQYAQPAQHAQQQAAPRLPSLTSRAASASARHMAVQQTQQQAQQQAQQAQQLEEAQARLLPLRRRVADIEAQLAVAQERLAAAQLRAQQHRRAEARLAALQAEIPRAEASIERALARSRAILEAELARQAAAEQQLAEAEGMADQWRRRFLHCVREHRPRPRPKQAPAASPGRVAGWVSKGAALFQRPRAQQAAA